MVANLSTPDRASESESHARNSPVVEINKSPGSRLVAFERLEECDMSEARGRGARVLTRTELVLEIGQGNE
jgi:hypothetical protein